MDTRGTVWSGGMGEEKLLNCLVDFVGKGRELGFFFPVIHSFAHSVILPFIYSSSCTFLHLLILTGSLISTRLSAWLYG